MYVGLLVEPRHDLLQESLQLGICITISAVETELGDPNRLAIGNLASGIDVRLEISGASVLVRVPVKIDEIDCAIGACVEEFLEVGQAVRGTGVCDGWSAEKGFAGKRLHVILVCADDGGNVHA